MRPNVVIRQAPPKLTYQHYSTYISLGYQVGNHPPYQCSYLAEQTRANLMRLFMVDLFLKKKFNFYSACKSSTQMP